MAMKRVRCPYCGSTHVNVQALTEKKGAGCLTWLICLLLACTVVGLIIVIPLMLSRNVTKTVAVCQDCGSRWQI